MRFWSHFLSFLLFRVMRLRSAAEKLADFNDDSEQLFSELGPKFAVKGKQLHGIKSELDVIFERIRCGLYLSYLCIRLGIRSHCHVFETSQLSASTPSNAFVAIYIYNCRRCVFVVSLTCMMDSLQCHQERARRTVSERAAAGGAENTGRVPLAVESSTRNGPAMNHRQRTTARSIYRTACLFEAAVPWFL